MTVKTEKIILNAERNVNLVTMVQAVGGEFEIAQRPGIVILPGGGYAMCSDREAEVVAYPYLEAGFHAFVLRYSVGEHKSWPNPLNDYDQAMEYILSHAKEWGLAEDKIAVIGFSAGGHLAGCAATLAKHRPNAAILGYAALEQDIASTCQPGTDIPSPTDHVDGQTPPCFLMACRDDPIVPIRNSVKFMLALEKNSVTYESHIYPYGGHGFSTAKPPMKPAEMCCRLPNWVGDSIGFLQDIFGELTSKGFGKPACNATLNGDFLPFLSTRCTIAHLHPMKGLCPELTAAFDTIEGFVAARFGSTELIDGSLGSFLLKDVLGMLNWSEEQIKSLDTVLTSIPL